MSVSTTDLDRFLSDLSLRRVRLVRAAVAGESLDRDLLELGEQLLVADEELRVQHEELTELRLHLAQTVAERDLMQVTVPTIITDGVGGLMTANAMAYQLTAQPPSPRRRRPVATWFAVTDRTRARDLMTRLATAPVGTRARQSALAVRRHDGTVVQVDAAVEVVAWDGGERVLRWQLQPAGSRSHLRLVAPDEQPVDDLLAEDLTAFARALADRADAPSVLAGIVDATAGLVPGVAAVALTVLRRGAAELSGATSAAAAALQTEDLERQAGPVWTAAEAGDGVVVRSADLAGDLRWPDMSAGSLHTGLRSVVSVCVALPALGRSAVLSCYGTSPDGLGEDAEHAVLLVGVHASIALSRALSEANLRAAVESRQAIGEAVGILAERDKLSTSDAFVRLVSASQRANRPLREVARTLVAAPRGTGD